MDLIMIKILFYFIHGQMMFVEQTRSFLYALSCVSFFFKVQLSPTDMIVVVNRIDVLLLLGTLCVVARDFFVSSPSLWCRKKIRSRLFLGGLDWEYLHSNASGVVWSTRKPGPVRE